MPGHGCRSCGRHGGFIRQRLCTSYGTAKGSWPDLPGSRSGPSETVMHGRQCKRPDLEGSSWLRAAGFTPVVRTAGINPAARGTEVCSSGRSWHTRARRRPERLHSNPNRSTAPAARSKARGRSTTVDSTGGCSSSRWTGWRPAGPVPRRHGAKSWNLSSLPEGVRWPEPSRRHPGDTIRSRPRPARTVAGVDHGPLGFSLCWEWGTAVKGTRAVPCSERP